MLRNQLYLGSVKDLDGGWHGVICSPNEDIVHSYCEALAGDTLVNDDDQEEEKFWSNHYTVEMLPIVIPEDEYPEEEDWDGSWEIVSMDDMLMPVLE